MNLTITTYKLRNKLFGTKIPQAVLNWNHPLRVQARKEMFINILTPFVVVFAVIIIGGADSIVELLLQYLGW
jgi:uncharacterized membrane protein YqaE (UPF0057 family)